MVTRRYGLRDDQWERIKDLLPGRINPVPVLGGTGTESYIDDERFATMQLSFGRRIGLRNWIWPNISDEITAQKTIGQGVLAAAITACFFAYQALKHIGQKFWYDERRSTQDVR